MEQEIIIGASVVITIAVIFFVKTFLYKLLNFKMDESAILNFFEGSDGDTKFINTEAISAGTDIAMGRVVAVCSKSKAIKGNPKEKESWCLRQ